MIACTGRNLHVLLGVCSKRTGNENVIRQTFVQIHYREERTEDLARKCRTDCRLTSGHMTISSSCPPTISPNFRGITLSRIILHHILKVESIETRAGSQYGCMNVCRKYLIVLSLQKVIHRENKLGRSSGP